MWLSTCRKSLCFLCPNPYPFPTGLSENTRVYAPGFGTIAAKMLRINPDPKKTLGIYSVATRDIAWDLSGGRSGYRLGFIRWPLGKSLGIFPVAARDIAWDLSGGRSGSSSGIFANVPYPISRRFQKSQVRPSPLNTPPDAFPNVRIPPSFLCLTDLLLHNPHPSHSSSLHMPCPMCTGHHHCCSSRIFS